MGLFSKFRQGSERNRSTEATPRQSGEPFAHGGIVEKQNVDNSPVKIFTPRVLAMVVIVSIGGLIFGYDTGQISGFQEMPDFLRRFADKRDPTTGELSFSAVRSGTIVGLLSIGTLIGALLAGPIADFTGRRISIVIWNVIFCVGVVVQIATGDEWYQVTVGRWVAGLGVGGLSVLTPMYQAETAPRQIRGALVSCYQLFITLGILVAYLINFGTEMDQGAAEWRIPMGVGFVWPVLMTVGIMTLRESPRWDFRRGKIDEARKTIALSYSVPEHHWEVNREMREIKAKLEAESADGGKHPWYEIFTGPRMAYRTLLGVTIQALQQLTGANFFFYYGTSIFRATGLNNSFVTSIILGAVNFGMTFPGVYIVEKAGRRKALMAGGAWQFVCFMIFSSIGHFSLDRDDPSRTPSAGVVMIVFACLFIAGYAMTWGPIGWAVTSEIYPSRYRAKCMGMATASNWVWNFLISFFTPFITGAIDYRYGYVFAACNFAAVLVVFFFLCESKGKTLEEIDTMYLMRVPPVKSSRWSVPATDEADADDRADHKIEPEGVVEAERHERRV